MLEYGHRIGLREMYFNPLLPKRNEKDFWRKYALSFDEWKKTKEIINQWNCEDNNTKAFAESSFDFSIINENAGNLNCDYAGCKAGKRELIITPDGFVAACPLVSTDRKFHNMNVRDYPLDVIWEKDEWISKLRSVDEHTIKGKCRECRFVKICKGGCHILALFECSDERHPDPRCPHRQKYSELSERR